MLGWLVPILNLLGLGAGTPSAPPPPASTAILVGHFYLAAPSLSLNLAAPSLTASLT